MKKKKHGSAEGREYYGPNRPEDMVEGSEFGDWYTGHLQDLERCKTIGVLPTSIINGGNASVVNGTVVYDPTP